MFDFVFRQLKSRKVCDPIFFSFRSFVFVIGNFQKKSSKNPSLRERDRISRNTKTQPPIHPPRTENRNNPHPSRRYFSLLYSQNPLAADKKCKKKTTITATATTTTTLPTAIIINTTYEKPLFPPLGLKKDPWPGEGRKVAKQKKKRRRKELLRKKSIKAKESKNLAKFVCARIIESAPPSPKRNVL